MDLLYRLGYDQRLLLALGLYFITVNPAFEELYWRGSVQNLMIKVLKDRPGIAILITALAFGAWHYLVLRLLLNPGYAGFAFDRGLISLIRLRQIARDFSGRSCLK